MEVYLQLEKSQCLPASTLKMPTSSQKQFLVNILEILANRTLASNILVVPFLTYKLHREMCKVDRFARIRIILSLSGI